jgi:hypothetical protein
LQYSSLNKQVKDWKAPPPQREENNAKEQWIKKYILSCALRLEFVSSNGVGLVNTRVKSFKMLREIILPFTKKGDTVLDGFSGSQVAEVALMARREVFVYTNNFREKHFVERNFSELAQKVADILDYVNELKQSLEPYGGSSRRNAPESMQKEFKEEALESSESLESSDNDNKKEASNGEEDTDEVLRTESPRTEGPIPTREVVRVKGCGYLDPSHIDYGRQGFLGG